MIRSSTTIRSKIFFFFTLADLLQLSLYIYVPFNKCGTTEIFLIPFINRVGLLDDDSRTWNNRAATEISLELRIRANLKSADVWSLPEKPRSKHLYGGRTYRQKSGGAKVNQHAADISTGYQWVRLSCYCFLFSVHHALIISPFLFFWLQGQGIKTSLPWEH